MYYSKDAMNDSKCGIEDVHQSEKRRHNDYVFMVADVIKAVC